MAAMSAPDAALPPIIGLSSMATRGLLAELFADLADRGGPPVALESVGGVDAERRVRAGEAFDLVILAADAIDRLLADGLLRLGSRVDLVRSPVAVAVPAGAPRPDIGSVAALRQAVQTAPRIGLSGGPSGAHLRRLFAEWGLGDAVSARLIQAPPGVPVGRLLASGEVALGFQQLSELMHLDGVDLLGPLPPGTALDTVFAAGIGAGSPRAAAVRECLAALTAPAAVPAMRRHGMVAAAAAPAAFDAAASATLSPAQGASR